MTNSATLLKTWPKVKEFFTVPRNEKEYNRLVSILDNLIDEAGDSSLMETIGLLIEAYEKDNYKIGKSSGIDVLNYLMTEHGIKQSDLPDIGSQGVVSEILNGKRDLNVRQIKALSERFNVSPAVFVS